MSPLPYKNATLKLDGVVKLTSRPDKANYRRARSAFSGEWIHVWKNTWPSQLLTHFKEASSKHIYGMEVKDETIKRLKSAIKDHF
jgi:hypothetical protein